MTQLPLSPTSFVGRDEELAHLCELVEETRVLTLAGPGGIGKTRLVVELARRLAADRGNAVVLVDLAPLRDASLLEATLAAALGIREQPGNPILQSVVETLGTQDVLVLDNCEHLIQRSAELVANLLQVCPNLRIVTTSRETLAIAGETVWWVPPLGVPAAADELRPASALRFASMRLFVDRARSLRADFYLTADNVAAIAQICRQLDGLPLAIELAAARVSFLSAEEIGRRLDDRFGLLSIGRRAVPPRHQTLRAAIEWSYDLLTPPEQRLFERLAVFSGGFALDAAEAVCSSDELPARDILGLLGRLVERSLVVLPVLSAAGEMRYRLLETLRAYALDKLAERQEVERVKSRHAAWLVDRAVMAEAEFHGPDQVRWFRWTEHEHENLRAAMNWAIARQDATTGAALVGTLWWGWQIGRHLSECQSWCEGVLALPHLDRYARARTLVGTGIIAAFRGVLEPARAWLEEALAIARQLGDDRVITDAFGGLLLLDLWQSRYADLESNAATLIELSRACGNRLMEARALDCLAMLELARGDLTRAAERAEQSLAIARAAGDRQSAAQSLNAMGDVERARGNFGRAGAAYEESLSLLRALELKESGARLQNLGYVALAAGALDLAAERFDDGVEQFRTRGDQRGLAECMLGLAGVALERRLAETAAHLLGTAEAVLRAHDMWIWASNLADYERTVAAVEHMLGPTRFATARQSGEMMSVDAALHEVRRVLRVPRGVEPFDSTGAAPLTPTEKRVASLLVRRLSNREIAEALVISERTAANHVQRVLEKLGVHSRTQVAARAAEIGLN